MSNTTENRNGTIVGAVGDHAISMSREFSASPATVFRALHDPEIVRQWIGPVGLQNAEVTGGTTHGDTWTLVQKDPNGNEYAFRGVTHGEASVENGSWRTFEWMGMAGHVSFEHVTFIDLGGNRTRVDSIAVYTSTEDRDGMFSSMGDGGYGRLDDVLANLD